MLGKLLKYEVRATGRTFLPLFAVLFLFTVINKIFFIIQPRNFSLPQGISMMVYVITLIGIFVATMLITIQRFYKSLLGDEGYLMFTLPVRPWQLITSKLIVSALWSIVSCVVAVGSIMVMAIGLDDLRAFPAAWRSIWQNMDKWFGLSPLAFFIELILLMLAGLALSILVVYVSIALGTSAQQQKAARQLWRFFSRHDGHSDSDCGGHFTDRPPAGLGWIFGLAGTHERRDPGTHGDVVRHCLRGLFLGDLLLCHQPSAHKAP